MNKFFALFVAAVVGLTGIARAADAVPVPEAMVRATSKEVMEVLKKESLPGNEKKLRDLIEAKILPSFDFTRITAQAVGKHWRDASPEQQAALVREFRTLLVRTYSTALTANKVQGIDVKPLKMGDADTDVIVKTEVANGGNQAFPIDYKLLKVSNNWKVYDVAVDGVSLVTNYRNSFNQTILKDGLDGLIKALSERNASAQAVKTTAK
ncbi:MlaC/ttg2D family ABC transporter substrate-binding protein [Parachitinimonas caeni]|uniref:ABC transporter substrate-binding protein n=1 Tax=Parachitinimonas caeni TaxID=3031301 RepID=A0ABT7DVN1_9NEIS|nr:ABC transporter substrate-binding protein [Parachitinimonas caeni]MDK2123158.1 ABC transporter substrate-binding protein [Parachitinimonas caeni]